MNNWIKQNSKVTYTILVLKMSIISSQGRMIFLWLLSKVVSRERTK